MTTPLAATRPDAADLSPEDIERLCASLVADLDAQRHHLAELQVTAESLMGQTDSDSLLERELAERGSAHALEVIADIQHALSKIDSGAYGPCERCESPIARARLEAIPHARFCVNCPSDAPRLIG
jgi:DnaK suppressor protein